MSEHDLHELAKILKKSIFSTTIKWITGIIATIISAAIIATITLTWESSYGTKQNTIDLQIVYKQLDQKVDYKLFEQYLQENKSAHSDILSSQKVMENDIKELLKRGK